MIPYKIIQKNESVVVIEVCGEIIQLSSSINIDNYLTKRYCVDLKHQPEVIEEVVFPAPIDAFEVLSNETSNHSKRKSSK